MNTPHAQKKTLEQIPVSEVQSPLPAKQQAKSEAENVYEANLKKLPDDLLLKAILFNKAIAGAIGSLLFWGIINLGAWFFFKPDMTSVFRRINAPAGTFDILLYGGAVISITMLIFGLAGVATRTRIIGWMDGVSLLFIGGWNLAHDFLLMSVVKSYGYTIEKPGTFWIILGIVQIIWGARQLLRFKSPGGMPSGIKSNAKNNTREKLRRMVQTPVSRKTGRLKFSITCGFPFHRKKYFTMWLLPHKAFCLENGLNEYFEIERKALRGEYFSDLRVVIKDRNNITRKLDFKASSLSGFNSWLSSDGVEDSKIKAGLDSNSEEIVEARMLPGLAPAENVIFNDFKKMVKDNGNLQTKDILIKLVKKYDFNLNYVTGAIEKGIKLKKSSSDFKNRLSGDRVEDSKIKAGLDSNSEEIVEARMLPGLAPAENVIFNDFIKIVKDNGNLQTKRYFN